MDVLWEKRQRGSNLVGTVINIHNGDWVRRGEPRVIIDNHIKSFLFSVLYQHNSCFVSLLVFRERRNWAAR